jgi:hypothetical protein
MCTPTFKMRGDISLVAPPAAPSPASPFWRGGLRVLNHMCFSPLPYLFLSFYFQLLLMSLLLGSDRRGSEVEQGCGSRIRREEEGARRRRRGRGACRGARARRARPQRRPPSAVSRSDGGAASSPPAAAAERGAGAGEGRRWWGRHGGGVGAPCSVDLDLEQGLLSIRLEQGLLSIRLDPDLDLAELQQERRRRREAEQERRRRRATLPPRGSQPPLQCVCGCARLLGARSFLG